MKLNIKLNTKLHVNLNMKLSINPLSHPRKAHPNTAPSPNPPDNKNWWTAEPSRQPPEAQSPSERPPRTPAATAHRPGARLQPPSDAASNKQIHADTAPSCNKSNQGEQLHDCMPPLNQTYPLNRNHQACSLPKLLPSQSPSTHERTRRGGSGKGQRNSEKKTTNHVRRKLLRLLSRTHSNAVCGLACGII